jgi:hypothetical protein
VSSPDAPLATGPRGGGFATVFLLGFSAAVFGLLGGLPSIVGPIVGIAGVAGSHLWRRWRPTAGTAPLAPVLLAIAALALTSPPVAASELFGGLTGLALLLWIADDPARPSGGGRRAAPAIALIALALGLTWAISLALPSRTPEVGIAGGLLAGAFVALAWLVGRPQALLRPAARNP